VTWYRLSRRHTRDSHRRPHVGLFGNLGSKNIGNDASLEAMLKYLSADQPGAIVDAMCSGPDTVKNRYGVPAIALRSLPPDSREAPGMTAALKVLGKGIDTIRIASWVRHHEVVIVPGMGVLETSIPLRPWQFPYDLFVLCASGRIFRTKVALVSVGASVPSERLTRWLFAAAGRLAFYRSYRDTLSRDAMRRQGLDTTRDHVYTDLAFGLIVPSTDPGDERTVGIGLMDYRGNEDDLDPADQMQIRASYVEKMKSFTRWLVDNGRRVRLFVGDTNNADETVVEEIVADLRTHRPDLDPTWVAAEPVSTFADLMRAMEPAGVVVATRYHNVICALMLSKPTISIGYGEKNAVLMADAGLAEYCQSVKSLDVGRLIGQLTDLENQSARLRQAITQGNAAKAPLVESQLKELSAVLFQSSPPASSPARLLAADDDADWPRRTAGTGPG
jgi:polysaccharide pyruvyl transferase WcaK-like protein